MGNSLTHAADPARGRWRWRATATALVALLAILPNACVVVSGDAKDSSATAVAVVDLDSAKRADQAPADSAATARVALQLARDSATVQRMSDSVRKAMAMDSIPPITSEEVAMVVPRIADRSARRDLAPVTASPAEITALGAALMIPVQGIPASALRDSYIEPRGGGTRSHQAIDIPAVRGTPVLSATDGRVLRKYSSKDGGLMIYAADAGEKFILMYAHLDRYADGLADGLTLRKGEIIGYVGTTGNAPPNVPHLHFALARAAAVRDWWKGTPINPFPLLAAHGR